MKLLSLNMKYGFALGMPICVLLSMMVPWISAQETGFRERLSEELEFLQDFPKHPTTDLKNESKNITPRIPRFPSEEEGSDFQSFVAQPFDRKMTVVPEPKPKTFFDAGDLRDPFLLLRGQQTDPPNLFEPGKTVDGIRFYSYSDVGSFMEQNYRDSNFSINDIFGHVISTKKGERCLSCHYGIEAISENHNFKCTQCHAGNGRTRSKSKAHKGMVSNPSDLNHAPKFCGKCHADQIEKVRQSLMATVKGEINLTRYAWGVQLPNDPPFSLFPAEGEQVYPQVEPKEKEEVDQFLRNACLRCHVQAPAPHRAGDYRATGCAACHMIYTNDGKTMTRDRAIQNHQKAINRKRKKHLQRKDATNSLRNPRGYPVLHRFTTAIPSVQCEHCHQLNGPGGEYEGRFTRPARHKPSGEKIDNSRPVLYGSHHDLLVPDIHREKGLHCIDCHGPDEIKSGGSEFQSSHDIAKVRCEDCHGTSSKSPDETLLIESLVESKAILKMISLNPNLSRKIEIGDVILVDSQGRLVPNVKKDLEDWVLISKVTGKEHKIPILTHRPKISAHQLKAHMDQVECSACHARWAANEWGTHVIFNEESDPDRWRDWNFSDPVLQHLISSRSKEDDDLSSWSKSLNWLTARWTKAGIQGEWENGTWIRLISEPDWKHLVLGKNERGKYSILKPRFQYWLSQQNHIFGETRTRIPITADGRSGLMMVPYSPHTIRKTPRPCESCHNNPQALGLGDPKRQRLRDGMEFMRTLQAGESPPGRFQHWQMMTQDGQNLQTLWPLGKARFLAPEEILSLGNLTDQYRAYRYFSLRERGIPRLLMRDKFPVDEKHQTNESLLGDPPKTEEDFYDPEHNELIQNGPKISNENLEIEGGVPDLKELGFSPSATSQATIEFFP